MLSAGATAVAVTPVGADPSLVRVVGRRFGHGTTPLSDPVSVEFFPALGRVAGVPVRSELLVAESGNSFDDMAAAVLPDMIGRQPIDLIIIAHAAPDLLPGDSAGPSVAARLAGQPVAFAMTDQGSGTGFTAVRLAQTFLLRVGVDAVIVLLADQRTSPLDTEQHELQRITEDVMVGLLFQRSATPLPIIQRRTSGTPERLLDATLDELGSGPSTTVLAGAGVPESWAGPARGTVVRLAAGHPTTALWLGLHELAGSGSNGPVILLDYDRDRGGINALRLDDLPAAR